MGGQSITWEEIVEVVGEDAAQALGRKWGGVSKYIPSSPRRGGLPELLGPEAAQALAARFGGSTLMIPNTTRRKQPKKVRIIELIAAGWSTRRIALKVKCTEDWVKMVRREYNSNVKQA